MDAKYIPIFDQYYLGQAIGFINISVSEGQEELFKNRIIDDKFCLRPVVTKKKGGKYELVALSFSS